ncbi:MAG: hypothetical protein ACLQOO_30275, partial [Terriglobia bacterium]
MDVGEGFFAFSFSGVWVSWGFIVPLNLINRGTALGCCANKMTGENRHTTTAVVQTRCKVMTPPYGTSCKMPVVIHGMDPRLPEANVVSQEEKISAVLA